MCKRSACIYSGLFYDTFQEPLKCVLNVDVGARTPQVRYEHGFWRDNATYPNHVSRTSSFIRILHCGRVRGKPELINTYVTMQALHRLDWKERQGKFSADSRNFLFSCPHRCSQKDVEHIHTYKETSLIFTIGYIYLYIRVLSGF